MTIKNKTNWMLKRYFFPSITLFGIIYCQYISPVNSLMDFVREIVKIIFILLISAGGVMIVSKISEKKITISEDQLIIKKTLRRAKVYSMSEVHDAEYERGIRTRSGHYGNQLRFEINKKEYIINSTEYDRVEQFVMCLQKRIPVEFI